MNTKQLLVPLTLIALCVVGITPADAAAISFSEDPNETTAIQVTTDIAGATIAAGAESASLSLGNVTGPSTLVFRRQMINMGTMTGEGGGGGVSDILELDSFVLGERWSDFWQRFGPTPTRSPKRAYPPWETSLRG